MLARLEAASLARIQADQPAHPCFVTHAQVGARVFDKCIKGALRGKTRLLVTHQLGVLPEVDRVIIMGSPSAAGGPRRGGAGGDAGGAADDGSCTIVDQGTLAELLARGHDLSKLVAPAREASEEVSEKDVAAATDAFSAVAEAVPATVVTFEASAAAEPPQADAPAPVAAEVVTSMYTSFPSLSGVSVTAAPLDVDDEGAGGNEGAPSAVSVSDFAAMVPPTGGIVDACSFGVTEDGSCAIAADAGSEVEVTNTTAPAVPVAVPVAASASTEMYHSAGTLATPTSALPAATGLRPAAARPSVPAAEFSPHVADGVPTGEAVLVAPGGGPGSPSSAVTAGAAGVAASGGTAPPPVRKLMTAEERGEGAVGWSFYRAYLLAADKPAMIAMMMASYGLGNAANLLQQWIVAAWTSDVGYVTRPLSTYLCGVAGMAFLVAFFNWARTYVGCLVGSSASRTIHRNMARQVRII